MTPTPTPMTGPIQAPQIRKPVRSGPSLLALLTLLFLLGISLLTPPASAGGIGASFSYGRSNGDVDEVDNNFADLDTSADIYEFGLSYDSNLAGNSLINYRINLNVQHAKQELRVGGVDIDLQGTGFSINQLLGFGFFRTKNFRAFVGPSLHLGLVVIDDQFRVSPSTNIKYEEVLFTASVGPEIGFNFHAGRHLTMSVSGYYRYGFQLQGYDSPYSAFGNDETIFTGDEGRVGITTSIYFRFANDQFK